MSTVFGADFILELRETIPLILVGVLAGVEWYILRVEQSSDAQERTRAMINGRQIGEARRLLGWSTEDLAGAARVALKAAATAEHQAIGVPIPRRQETALRRALEAAGIEFISENGEGGGARLRTTDAP